jgi:hypothetical protein
MFLALRCFLVLHCLGMFAGRVMPIAHRRILACSVLVALRRVFLLLSAIFVPSSIVVADLGHARGCGQKCCCGECRKNLHPKPLLLAVSGKKGGSRFW